MQVKPTSRRSKLVVAVDGAGIANHAGSAALAELADSLGWTRALSTGMAPNNGGTVCGHVWTHPRRRQDD